MFSLCPTLAPFDLFQSECRAFIDNRAVHFVHDPSGRNSLVSALQIGQNIPAFQGGYCVVFSLTSASPFSHPHVSLANERAEACGLKVYYPYIPNWHNDEPDHYIKALILAEEKGVSIYIECGFLEDILPGCMWSRPFEPFSWLTHVVTRSL